VRGYYDDDERCCTENTIIAAIGATDPEDAMKTLALKKRRNIYKKGRSFWREESRI